VTAGETSYANGEEIGTRNHPREATMARAMIVAGAIAAVVAISPTVAAGYPTRPVALVLGFAPGGPSDVIGRILSRKLEQLIRQPVVIENRTGAGGSVAGQAVARAAPDGYTLLLASGSILAINQHLYKNIG
jgi:tripartite-type tricarboxylate transporter receptor subunit TctC